MNSVPVANQGLLGRLFMRINGLEKAKLCEVVDRFAGPPNPLNASLSVSSGPRVCPEAPLPFDSPIKFLEPAEMLRESLEAHPSGEDFFLPEAPMGYLSECEGLKIQSADRIEFVALVGG